MEIGGLDFAGRTEASRALIELKRIYREAVARVGALDAEQRAASVGVQTRSAELAELHRAGDASPAKVKSAEQALALARARSAEPWSERITGARSAVRDAAGGVQRFVCDNYDALAAELSEDAQEVAERVDGALNELVAAFAAREGVSARLTALASLVVGAPKPGLVPSSRVEQVVREAERALMAGGERPPVARDPRPQEATA
jgi:hypothetical protein